MVRNIYIILASLLLAVALHQAVPAYAETAAESPGDSNTSPAPVQQAAPAANDDTSPAAAASDNAGMDPEPEQQVAPAQNNSAKPAAEASGADPDNPDAQQEAPSVSNNTSPADKPSGSSDMNPAAIQEAASAAKGDTSIIPLPVFATSRNGGNDYGFMPVWLFKENEYIYGIFAPSVIYNDNTGLNLTLRYFGFPTIEKRYRLFFNQAIGVDREVTAEYWDDKFYNGDFKVYGKATFFKDSTYRFFGLTEASREEDETNYANDEFSPEVSIGYYLPNNLTLSLRERFRWVTISRGKIDTLPYIKNEFRSLDGVSGGAVLNNRLSLTYDSCAGGICPLEGWLATIYGEANMGFTHGRPYTRIGLDVKKYFALDSDGRFITVVKGAFELTGGRHVPFFERSTIGGENTLRGYGRYRFVDDGFVLFNLEERIRMFKLHIFGVWSDWEIAPFVDVGRVFSSMQNQFFRHYKINPGVGFRAIVQPNVVGRVDLGYSEEGITAFVGLDFPF